MDDVLDCILIIFIFIPPFFYFFGGIILDIIEGYADENKGKEVKVKKIKRPRIVCSRFYKSPSNSGKKTHCATQNKVKNKSNGGLDMKCNIEILHEVSKPMEAGWSLCFQYCKYHYDGEGEESRECELGYRFIWRKPDGTLQPARGQARIPNMADIMELTALAMREGWGNE